MLIVVLIHCTAYGFSIPTDSSQTEASVQFDQFIAKNEFDKALNFSYKMVKESRRTHALYMETLFLANISKCFYLLGEKEKFRFYNQKSLHQAIRRNYPDIERRCLHNEGVYWFERSNYQKAIHIFETCIDEKHLDFQWTEKANPGNSYRMLSTSYDVLGDWDKAIVYNLKAQDVFSKVNNQIGVLDAKIFLARIYRSKGELAKATEIIDDVIQKAQVLKHDETIRVAYSMKSQIAYDSKDYKSAYIAQNVLYEWKKNRFQNNLTQQIAQSEAKFKVSDIDHDNKLSQLEIKQKGMRLLWLSITISSLVFIGLLIFVYLRRLQSNQQKELEALAKVNEAKEQERWRIARDLHDNMGAYTTALIANIDRLSQSDSPHQNETIAQLKTDAEAVMSTLRETIWLLQEEERSLVDFIDFVQNYAYKFADGIHGIQLRFEEDVSTDWQLSAVESQHLFRMLQEGIQNTCKYAQATTLTLSVIANDTLIIVLKDDGIGFDTTQVAFRGLQFMNERAKQIDAALEIASEPGNGTTVKITLTQRGHAHSNR